jgi:hypothetical protein
MVRPKPKPRPEKQLVYPEQEGADNVIEPPGPPEKRPDVVYPGARARKVRKEE